MLRKTVEDQAIIDVLQAKGVPLTADEIAKGVKSVRARVNPVVNSLESNGVLSRIIDDDTGQSTFVYNGVQPSSTTRTVQAKEKSARKDNPVRHLNEPAKKTALKKVTPAQTTYTPAQQAPVNTTATKSNRSDDKIDEEQLLKARILAHLVSQATPRDELLTLFHGAEDVLRSLEDDNLIELLVIMRVPTYEYNENKLDEILKVIDSVATWARKTDQAKDTPDIEAVADVSATPDIGNTSAITSKQSEVSANTTSTEKTSPLPARPAAGSSALESQIMDEMSVLVKKLVDAQLKEHSVSQLKEVGQHVKEAASAMQLALNALNEIGRKIEQMS